MINLYVGKVAEQLRRAGVLPCEGVDRLAKRVCVGAELGADIPGKLDAGGRDARGLGNERLGRFVR